ncbi:hypothetical protein Patl1_29907 [Pistacia atlantica]|uniref:Uncharacterized protein n=1 Tax=Pistacia atlantica TaxID=434234 RepID=A0ACC1A7M3_9ROSI|nr:hypothetical protein Patl1_29907 [Pistacia atlantica]
MLVYLKFLGNKQKSFLSIAAVDSLSRLLDLKVRVMAVYIHDGINEEEITRSSWLVGQWAVYLNLEGFEIGLTTEAVFSPDLVSAFHLVASVYHPVKR